jgi:hypothetical protein
VWNPARAHDTEVTNRKDPEDNEDAPHRAEKRARGGGFLGQTQDELHDTAHRGHKAQRDDACTHRVQLPRLYDVHIGISLFAYATSGTLCLRDEAVLAREVDWEAARTDESPLL